MSREVPDGWRKATLAELADYHNGRAFKPTDWGTVGLPIIRIAQITSPDADTEFYSGDDVEERHLVQDGDLLFSWSATLTVTKWSRGNGVLNQHIFKVVPRSVVDPDFLLYTLEYSIDALAAHSHGSTMKHIKKGVLKLHEIALPPLAEQRRIADILSSVDEAIQTTQAVIEQTGNVKRAALQSAMEQAAPCDDGRRWPTFTLDELTPKDRRVTYGIVQAGPHVPDGVPYVRVSDMGERSLSPEGMLRTSPEIAAKFTRSTILPGDIVFALRGKIGHVLKTPATLSGANLTQGTARIAPGEKISADFLLWALRSPMVERQIRSAVKGSTFKEITLGDLKAIRIPVPPPDRQEATVQTLNGIEMALWAAHDHRQSLTMLKVSLMSDLLTGRKRLTADLPLAAE